MYNMRLHVTITLLPTCIYIATEPKSHEVILLDSLFHASMHQTAADVAYSIWVLISSFYMILLLFTIICSKYTP